MSDIMAILAIFVITVCFIAFCFLSGIVVCFGIYYIRNDKRFTFVYDVPLTKANIVDYSKTSEKK